MGMKRDGEGDIGCRVRGGLPQQKKRGKLSQKKATSEGTPTTRKRSHGKGWENRGTRRRSGESGEGKYIIESATGRGEQSLRGIAGNEGSKKKGSGDNKAESAKKRGGTPEEKA